MRTTFSFFYLLLATLSFFGFSQPLEKVSVQLGWLHQFQFAGFYAAKQQGYYKQVGLDVSLLQANPNTEAIEQLRTGQVDFATGNSEVVMQRLSGKPIVALAAIIQKSPLVFVSLKKSGIKYPQDFIGRRIMMSAKKDQIDLLSVLTSLNIPLQQIQLQDNSFNIDDLITGKTDVFSAYLSNEPYYIEEQGHQYNIIHPADYGIDAYSDFIYTCEEMIEEQPELVQKFTEATIKGWYYALDHPEELIQLIKKEYAPEKSLNHLRYEANVIRELIRPDLVEIGHISPTRIKKIAESAAVEGFDVNLSYLDDFIFQPSYHHNEKLRNTLTLAFLTLVLVCLFTVHLMKVNRNFKREIIKRADAESKLAILAATDPLTQLANRRAFFAHYDILFNQACSENKTFSLILMDIDHFKLINDEFGHQAGDTVLSQSASLFKSELREGDVCARFGGEEFVFLLPNLTLSAATMVAERIRVALEQTPIQMTLKRNQSITGSFGVVEFDHSMNKDELMSLADQLMYQAKNNGRNTVVSSVMATQDQQAVS